MEDVKQRRAERHQPKPKPETPKDTRKRVDDEVDTWLDEIDAALQEG